MTSILYHNNLDLKCIELKTPEQIEQLKDTFIKIYGNKFKISKWELRDVRNCKYIFISDSEAFLIYKTGCERVLSTGNLCGNNKYLGQYCKNCAQLQSIWD
jgi:hypothetical protein